MRQGMHRTFRPREMGRNLRHGVPFQEAHAQNGALIGAQLGKPGQHRANVLASRYFSAWRALGTGQAIDKIMVTRVRIRRPRELSMGVALLSTRSAGCVTQLMLNDLLKPFVQLGGGRKVTSRETLKRSHVGILKDVFGIQAATQRFIHATHGLSTQRIVVAHDESLECAAIALSK